ncbi:MAG: hypothetical protein IR164_16535 [Devosia sp.]|uniref:hypothetical protein n=1 Tax=Devosia sp. TaxID=1871048 RepID=UPI0019FB9C0E|nr:hypothetical protein [Devosia sp.]MBF0680533.1 hypothetical protein [Devosia sp.]
MSLELIDITLAERQLHPRLANRVTGKVRAILTEELGGVAQRHELLIPAWVERKDGMTEEDVDLALLVKAAEIVGRLKTRLG